MPRVFRNRLSRGMSSGEKLVAFLATPLPTRAREV